MKIPPVRIGTSSWSSPDWRGKIYEQGAQPRDFLAQYARHFDTVECDATFYGVPRATTVDGWRARTPEGFLLSSKLPREITHERGLVDCADTLQEFLAVMGRLEGRMGPVTTDLIYVRFLGHHREMDQLIARQRAEGRRDSEWGETALDRSAEIREWVEPLRAESIAGARVMVYFNNHYAGYAPGSALEFRRMWNQTSGGQT